jgi:hyperosmotically inducible protein
MFRLVVLAALATSAAWMLGYRWSDLPGHVRAATGGPEPGSWTEDIDRERIRQAGSDIAARIGEGAGRAEAVFDEAKLTAKIKAKIALDDTLEGSRIDVDTDGAAVSLRGSVATSAQRDRALQLARETEGVASVADRLLVQPR